MISRVALFDGIRWNEILASGGTVGHNGAIPIVSCKISEQSEDFLRIVVVHESKSRRLEANYEIHGRGYVVCTFALEVLEDQATCERLCVGVPLDEQTVFSHAHRVLNSDTPENSPRFARAIAVDFSTDDRPATNSVNFLLETTTPDSPGRTCRKIYESRNGYRFIGWELENKSTGSFSAGDRYKNRWCLTLTGMDNHPNKVRGQRIYHWYGLWPTRYPSDDLLEEMAEYGCSILALHMAIFTHISGSIPQDERDLRRVIDGAHRLGMKVIFYCQPYLISIESPDHADLMDCRTEGLRVWHSMAETQIVFYEPNRDYDCDELCLRCEKAFDFICGSVLDCWEKYGFDGLYIDWCWPAEGRCSDPRHNHLPGLFNFYDYLRMIRRWRKAVGPDGIIIGHGGGLLVSSDFVEAFDGCLTGEAQQDLDPATIGQSFGPAPTLWTMHRRKQDAFRSARTIEQLVREGMTPHTGLGVMGTSILATLDPAHHTPLLALWQMWRAFPVHRATFYNYLTEKVIALDNPEVFYSLYVTADKQVLLILANAGGPEHDRSPAVGVNARLDVKKLGLPREMNCWRMKGNTYETFRVSGVSPVEDGLITVPELLKHEFVGFVLSPGEAPGELIRLMKHLEGRPDRLPDMLRAKQKRLAEFDKLIDCFATLPTAANKLKYDEFMKDRVAE
jgi:hypothetical protein